MVSFISQQTVEIIEWQFEMVERPLAQSKEAVSPACIIWPSKPSRNTQCVVLMVQVPPEDAHCDLNWLVANLRGGENILRKINNAVCNDFPFIN